MTHPIFNTNIYLIPIDPLQRHPCPKPLTWSNILFQWLPMRVQKNNKLLGARRCKKHKMRVVPYTWNKKASAMGQEQGAFTPENKWWWFIGLEHHHTLMLRSVPDKIRVQSTRHLDSRTSIQYTLKPGHSSLLSNDIDGNHHFDLPNALSTQDVDCIWALLPRLPRLVSLFLNREN